MVRKEIAMKNTPWLNAEPYRTNLPLLPFTNYGDDYGLFLIPGPCNQNLAVMANTGKNDGWDHVSVSLKDRCPNWQEMSFVKDIFFKEDETVMQLHPAKSEHINFAENCLHLLAPNKPNNTAPTKKLSRRSNQRKKVTMDIKDFVKNYTSLPDYIKWCLLRLNTIAKTHPQVALDVTSIVNYYEGRKNER
jgi:hypothetical protein